MVWSEQEWMAFERETRKQLNGVTSDDEARELIVRRARTVMRNYTTSFYLVSRFLPRTKSDRVEIIYAAVRYPDEVVDTFPLAPSEKHQRLDAWSAAYKAALDAPSILDAVRRDVPSFPSAFADLVKTAGIPHEHYRAFLGAMRRDIEPRPYDTLQDLIDSYIYGSAIVVGFFLAYAYDARSPNQFQRVLDSARDLGIALQLTNFLRDVAEDARRGRLYLPVDLLREEGIEVKAAMDVLRKIVIANIPFYCIFMWSDKWRLAHEDIDSAAKRDSKFCRGVGSTPGG